MNKSTAFTNDKLLFLHGYLADSRSFYYQKKYFERYMDVFIPDLKGFGNNKGMTYPYSLDDYISEVREYMYCHNIVKPCVVAHSFGGRIAIKMAGSHKDIFDKIVLTGCAGLKPRFSLYKATKKFTFNILKKFISRDKLQNFYSSDYKMLDDVMKKSFVKIINEHLDDIAKGIKNKALIIVGDKDRDTPIYMAKRLHKYIENSTLSIYKDAGHFAFIDKPNKFNKEVKEFISYQ